MKTFEQKRPERRHRDLPVADDAAGPRFDDYPSLTVT